jgi:hypothetical protein
MRLPSPAARRYSHYRNHGGSDLPRQAHHQIPIPPTGITAVHLGIRYSLKSISQLAVRIQTPEPRRRIGSETFRSWMKKMIAQSVIPARARPSAVGSAQRLSVKEPSALKPRAIGNSANATTSSRRDFKKASAMVPIRASLRSATIYSCHCPYTSVGNWGPTAISTCCTKTSGCCCVSACWSCLILTLNQTLGNDSAECSKG